MHILYRPPAMRGRMGVHGSSIRIAYLTFDLAHLTFDFDLCRAENIQWSMAVELLVAVAAVGRNSQDRLTCIGVYTFGSSFHSPGFPQVCF